MRVGAPYRLFRFSSTQNNLAALADLPPEGDLRRKPGYFVTEMPEGRYYENGLESPDAMTLRLVDVLDAV